MTTELLSDEQLNLVAGGTAKEERQLCDEIVVNPDLKEVFNALVHMPFGPVGEAVVEKLLLDTMDIEAHIDLGIARTDQMSLPNTYKDLRTGKSITHAEVVQRIRKYEC